MWGNRLMGRFGQYGGEDFQGFGGGWNRQAINWGGGAGIGLGIPRPNAPVMAGAPGAAGLGPGLGMPRPAAPMQLPYAVPRGVPLSNVRQPVLGSFKKGGKVKKTGLYRLHKGEKVVSLSKLKGK